MVPRVNRTTMTNVKQHRHYGIWHRGEEDGHQRMEKTSENPRKRWEWCIRFNVYPLILFIDNSTQIDYAARPNSSTSLFSTSSVIWLLTTARTQLDADQKIKKRLIEYLAVHLEVNANNKTQEEVAITAVAKKPVGRAETLSMQVNLLYRFHTPVTYPPLQVICSPSPDEISWQRRVEIDREFGWGAESWHWVGVGAVWTESWLMFCVKRMSRHVLALFVICHDEIRNSVFVEWLFCFHYTQSAIVTTDALSEGSRCVMS